MYSVRKVWKAVGRLGIEAGRDRAARIIKCVDLQAATRIRRVRTLSPASAAAGSGSLIDARAPAADDAVATKRMMALVASVLILMIPAHDILAVVGGAPMASPLGGDFLVYRDAAARWVSGGGFYWLWQLSGRYAIWVGPSPILYPPVILLLLVPFTILPPFLWWAIPSAMIA